MSWEDAVNVAHAREKDQAELAANPQRVKFNFCLEALHKRPWKHLENYSCIPAVILREAAGLRTMRLKSLAGNIFIYLFSFFFTKHAAGLRLSAKAAFFYVASLHALNYSVSEIYKRRNISKDPQS